MSLPYFPLYPTDFDGDAGHLTLEEDGAYNRLLRIMWNTPGCSVPEDPAWIARKMRIDMVTYLRLVEPLIDEFCKRVGGRIYQKRLQEEWVKAEEATQKRVNAANARWSKSRVENKEEKPMQSMSNADALHMHPEPYPEPEPLEKEEAIASSKKPSRRRPEIELPEGWVPSERNISDAIERNFTPAEIDHEADKFRNHHLAKGNRYRDWDRAWLSWLGKAAEFKARGGMAGGTFPGFGGQGTSMASIVARRRLEGKV